MHWAVAELHVFIGPRSMTCVLNIWGWFSPVAERKGQELETLNVVFFFFSSPSQLCALVLALMYKPHSQAVLAKRVAPQAAAWQPVCLDVFGKTAGCDKLGPFCSSNCLTWRLHLHVCRD